MPEVIYYLIRPLSHFIITFGTGNLLKKTQGQGYFILVMSHLDFTPIPEIHLLSFF